jgi:hypothetical protein
MHGNGAETSFNTVGTGSGTPMTTTKYINDNSIPKIGKPYRRQERLMYLVIGV